MFNSPKIADSCGPLSVLPQGDERHVPGKTTPSSEKETKPKNTLVVSRFCSFRWSCAFFLIVAIAGCSDKRGAHGGEDATSADVAASGTAASNGNDTVPETLPAAPRYFGRFAQTPNGTILAWPGAGFVTTFSGTGLTATLSATHLKEAGAAFDVTVNVAVDGVNQPKVSLSPNQTAYTLAQNLANGTHTVQVTKLTEANVGIVQVTAIAPSEGGNFLSPPARKKRRIEVIADSEMTGYGVEAQVTSANMCTFTATTQNELLSIPAQIGLRLDADVNNVSYSGKGITRNLSLNDPVNTLPVIYKRPVPDDGTLGPWDFSLFPADVVLLDGGGNDLDGATGSGKFADPNLFVKTYVSFIQDVRKNFPHASIFCVLSSAAHNPTGMAATDPNAAIDPSAVGDRNVLSAGIVQAVAAAHTAGDPNVFYFDYFASETTVKSYDDAQQSQSLGFGCDYHPSTPGSVYLANKLAAQIALQMNW